MMDLTEEKKKRAEFLAIITDLARDKSISQNKSARFEMYKRLENLYYAPKKEDRYRHFYSDIFSFLLRIQDEDTEENAETLFINLSKIREGYQLVNIDEKTNEKIDISDSLKKLYDHVSLDLARIGYSRAEGREAVGKNALATLDAMDIRLKRVTRAEKDLKQRHDELEQKHNEIETATKGMQKEYVAILGVFAAVLMAFFSGVGFSSSTLSNIDKASIYRVILGILLLGTILFNMMGLLLSFIKEMVYKKTINKWWTIAGNLVFVLLLGWLYFAWRFSWLGVCETL
ncbi:MAG: hypothetical protein UIK37_12630 [Lachnospiraceae bacterium]|nr:hypothetical protein [Lachnospiraceae bacterium]DAH95514.1 MAG TPA: hypothetical protein [Caudoviricetes sp.]